MDDVSSFLVGTKGIKRRVGVFYESNSECNEEPIVDIIMDQVGSRLGLSALHGKE